MTFVFEAHRLPFGSVSEAYAARIRDLVTLHTLDDLPLWDRCMLAAVLPVVQELRGAPPAAPCTSRAVEDGDKPEATGTPIAPFAAAPSTALRRASNELRSGTSLEEDIAIALTIVHALDELEVVYDSIVSTRASMVEQRQGRCGAAGAPQVGTSWKKTSEEILMDDLLQERFGETAAYLPDSGTDRDGEDDEGGDDANGVAPPVVDIAMCFTTKGESLGIGSASVFGGHGYHP